LSEDFEGNQIPRDFELVPDPAEALRLVKEGAKTLSSAMIWTKDQEHVINSHMSVFSDAGHCFYCWVPKGFDTRQFMDDLAAMKQKECFFSVSLLRANIFFKAAFLGFDHAGMQFKFPSKVYKVQRRKDLRFPVPDSITIKVEFTDPLAPEVMITKKVVDISAGGLAFLINEDEAAIYPSGLTLENFTFSIRNKTLRIKAEIRHSKKYRGEGRATGVAVGVIFKDIRPGDSQHIAGFVFEESRKYFSRFI
jgi:hypothetical protein